jgi:hypothetical protein
VNVNNIQHDDLQQQSGKKGTDERKKLMFQSVSTSFLFFLVKLHDDEKQK